MPEDLLDGWKEIAGHFNIDTRTAQNWEKEKCLPIHRKGKTKRARVYAYKHELQDWQEKADAKPSRHHRSQMAVAGIAALLIAGIAWQWNSPGPPATWKITGTTLEVLDGQGRTCWTKPFPDLLSEAYSEPSPTRHGFLADIDEDSQAELVFSYLPQGIRDTTSGTLICYETDGKEKWRLDYGTPKNYGEREFLPYYETRILDTINTLGKLHILLVATHWRFPARVLLLDPENGSVVQEYWHPGHLSTHVKLDLDDDGEEELVLGGVNNPGRGLGHPALVVLDFPLDEPLRNLSDYYPVEFTGGGEAAYYLLPRPDIADALNIVFGIEPIQAVNGQLVLRLSSNSYGLITYHLTKNFEIIGAWPSDNFTTEHKKLELQGTLKPLDPTTLERIISFPTAPDANQLAIQGMFTEATATEAN